MPWNEQVLTKGCGGGWGDVTALFRDPLSSRGEGPSESHRGSVGGNSGGAWERAPQYRPGVS